MTTGIKNWSTTASDNDSSPPNGAPEGMAPASVNDVMRQIMAEVREWYEDPTWIDFGHIPTQTGGSTFTIATNVTSIYAVGRRIRMIGTTPFELYGTISNSSYSAPNTTVTVTLDSGSLDSTLSEVAINSASIGTSGLALLAADNSFTGKIRFPDDGELTISSGAVTVTGVYHTVDTESDAATDNLDTINGGGDGQLLIIRTEDNSRDVVLTQSGNIVTPFGVSVTLGTTSQSAALIYDGTLSKWVVIAVSSAYATAAQGALADTALQPANKITLGTMVASTSGTAIDFTSIPTGVKRIAVNFSGVSTNGTNAILVQLGDSGGIDATGYLGACTTNTASATTTNYTAGIGVTKTLSTQVLHGTITFTLIDAAAFLWAASGVIASSDSARTYYTAGSKALSATLDRLRITTSGGANTFDAGNINITYE